MTPDRRRPELVTLPTGRLWNEAAFRGYLAEIDRRDALPRLERLSTSDPFCISIERESRLPGELRSPDLAGVRLGVRAGSRDEAAGLPEVQARALGASGGRAGARSPQGIGRSAAPAPS